MRSLRTTLLQSIIIAIAAPSMALASGTLFYPIEPCRVMDTRNLDPADPLGGVEPGQTVEVSFVLANNTPQGGEARSCGIPATAVAVDVNLVMVYAYGNGYVKSWPSGGAAPLATVANYRDTGSTAGQNNHATLRISGSGAAHPSSAVLGVYVHEVGIIVDVFGYWEPAP